MNEPKRRFFSGDSLQQALVQAANHFNLAPEEIAYRSIEKRHGFLKVRRKVVIEVNPDAPKREPGSLPPAGPEAPAEAADGSTLSGERAAVVSQPAQPERRTPRGDRPPRRDRNGPGRRNERRNDRRNERRNERQDDRGRDDRGNRIDPREDPRRRRPVAPRYPRDVEREPAAGVDPLPPAGAAAMGSPLVTLPDSPRRPSERFPPAAGPMAEAATKGVELLLRIAGLELTPRVLQGADRLEVDLSGSDVDWCFADDGEFVLAVEHLLPRMIRSLSGEATLVRVDCDNFQEIREERLRSLAQQVADEVRRRGRPRTLEPMNPADRRIVHITLADDPGVVTQSEGDGYFKRITVRPT